MESSLLKCRKCLWKGTREEVHWETVETCMGTDKTEVCPNCGSMEVYDLKY